MGRRTRACGRSWWQWGATVLIWTTFYACGGTNKATLPRDAGKDGLAAAGGQAGVGGVDGAAAMGGLGGSGASAGSGGVAGTGGQGGSDSGAGAGGVAATGGQGGTDSGAGAGGAAGNGGQGGVFCGEGAGGVTGSGGQGGMDASAGGTGASAGQGGADASAGQGGTSGGSGAAGTAGSSGSGGTGGTSSYPGDVSGTRLKAEFWAGSDGAKHYSHAALYDSQLSIDCAYATASDGQLRCLPIVSPTAMQGVIYYSDASCTQPMSYVSDNPPAPCTPYLPQYVYSGQQTCPYGERRFRIYPVQSIITNPTPHKLTNGTCSNANVSYPSMTPVALGAELSASSFVAGTRTHLP